MLSLEEMRAALLAKQSGQGSQKSSNSKFFSFTKLQAGDKVRVRFLQDVDPNNQYFWRVNAVRSLVFNGLISGGQFIDGEIKVDVPAFNLKKGEVDNTLPEEYRFKSEDDPIQQKIQNLWNEGPTGQEIYRKFKRRESYIYRGLVRSDNSESKFQYFSFSSKIQPLIQMAFTDEEQFQMYKDLPVDVVNGRDFIINVTEEAGRKSYTTSKYSLQTSALTQEELDLIKQDEYQVPLTEYISKKPTLEQLEVMTEMYEALTNDQPFDYDKWSPQFKPKNAYKDSNGSIQIRSYGDNSSKDEEEETPSPKATTVEYNNTSIVPPTQITTEEVNKAMSDNTVKVNNDNVNDMVANLLAQFKSNQ